MGLGKKVLSWDVLYGHWTTFKLAIISCREIITSVNTTPCPQIFWFAQNIFDKSTPVVIMIGDNGQKTTAM